MIINGDCLDEMKKMPDNSVDFIVTDSPYGISFMSKEWDQQIPSVEYWREMLRICKPGAMMAAAGIPRMYHRLACIIEDSGWQIRDCILHIFGSGFPKSHNFGRKIGGQWEGFGTALKPAYEPWLIAMKPINGTFAQNAEKWGVAGINIDESRVGTDKITTQLRDRSAWHGNKWGEGGYEKPIGKSEPRQGRWPANIILDEESSQQLDEMSGVSISKSNQRNCNASENKCMSGPNQKRIGFGHNDSGGASRFFYCAKASSKERNAGLEGMESKFIKTMNDGIGKRKHNENEPNAYKKNFHPTVKPIALMKYLLKLLCPPGKPVCLDPFAGSGSTLVAAKELGITCIGIEKESEYCEIAKKRIENASFKDEQLEFAI